jgi:DNA repair protein RadC
MIIKEYSLTYKRKNVDIDKLSNSNLVDSIARNIFKDFMNIYECFYIFLMDNQNNIKGFVKISQGGITGANVDIRLIAKYAIETLATKVILVHNHPSGALMPSREDKTLTQNVSKALELFDIRVVDHLILTEDDYYSFSDEGLI